jgi:peroxiredoxin
MDRMHPGVIPFADGMNHLRARRRCGMPTLATRLAAFRDAMLERAGPEKAAAIVAAYQAAVEAGLAGRALGVGEAAPDFALPDFSGRTHRLADARAKGPVVLVFYRGLWCPFCAKTLRAMDAMRPALEREGATLLAASPQEPAHAMEAASCLGLGLTLLHDRGCQVAARYRIVWPVPENMRLLYAKFGHPLALENGDDGSVLPMPAAFVIGPDGVVAAAKVDPRPSVRMEPADALAAVRAIARVAA